jgi:acetyl esterase
MELTREMLDAVVIEEQRAPSAGDGPDVRVLLYRPAGQGSPLPLVLNIHGGAFGMRADHFPASDAALAMLGALVVSVDYRSLPADRYPCAPDDCYAALCWAVNELDIDHRHVVVTGASAGGALAAAVTLMARDRGGPNITFQALNIPALDDRCETVSMRQYREAPVFGGRHAVEMWTAYLGGQDRQFTPAYAAPNRAETLAGLPPAFIQVGALDPLRDEGIAYAMRLLEHGVPVELYCAPGMHHGFPADPRTAAHARMLYHDAITAAIQAD